MQKIGYAGYRFPPEIIEQAIWLYLRFTLSFRDVEDLLAARGIMVSYETVRRWVNHFGHAEAATLGIGFSWGGWMLGSTAKTLADSTASSAATAPICADPFQRSADAAVFLTALKAAGR
jgi:hypothetical protein